MVTLPALGPQRNLLRAQLADLEQHLACLLLRQTTEGSLGILSFKGLVAAYRLLLRMRGIVDAHLVRDLIRAAALLLPEVDAPAAQQPAQLLRGARCVFRLRDRSAHRVIALLLRALLFDGINIIGIG